MNLQKCPRLAQLLFVSLCLWAVPALRGQRPPVEAQQPRTGATGLLFYPEQQLPKGLSAGIGR